MGRSSNGEALRKLSPWLVDPPDCAPSLEGERTLDVAVIGAGITGLSAALALRREGQRVAVLEAGRVGTGASGRNAGHLTPTIGKDLPTLTRMYGRERVGGLLRLAEFTIAHVEELIHKHAIDCDYRPVGNLVAAVHPRQHYGLDRAAETAALHGAPAELLDSDELERRGIPRAFTRALLEPHGGVLDPARYLWGLRRAALEAGAELYEQSPVVSIEEGGQPLVRTPAGHVRCRHVVIATNAYTPSLRRLRSAGIRLQVQLFRTEPLSPAQRSAVGWSGGEGIYTAHQILESYRLTPDDRIVGGSKRIRAGFGRGSVPDVDPQVCRLLEETFRQRFPELRDLRIAEHWGGAIYLSLDFLPAVGRTGRNRNILHSVAYAGHGIALASYAGEMLADLLLERTGPGAVLWSRRRIPTPPEPLRWLAVRAITRALTGIDRRVDRLAVGRAGR